MDRAQLGFRKGKRTRNAIFALRIIIGRSIEKKKDQFMCFVDFEKAIDTVRHEVLVERLMTNMYWGPRAVVRIEND